MRSKSRSGSITEGERAGRREWQGQVGSLEGDHRCEVRGIFSICDLKKVKSKLEKCDIGARLMRARAYLCQHCRMENRWENEVKRRGLAQSS